jgi:hypothetical protein
MEVRPVDRPKFQPIRGAKSRLLPAQSRPEARPDHGKIAAERGESLPTRSRLDIDRRAAQIQNPFKGIVT